MAGHCTYCPLICSVFLWMITCLCTNVTLYSSSPNPSTKCHIADYAVSTCHVVLLDFMTFTFRSPSAVIGLLFSVTIHCLLFVCGSFPSWLAWRYPPDSYFKFSTEKCSLLLSYFSHFSMLEVRCKCKIRVENEPGTYKNRNHH